jgi:hypothetical protein
MISTKYISQKGRDVVSTMSVEKQAMPAADDVMGNNSV